MLFHQLVGKADDLGGKLFALCLYDGVMDGISPVAFCQISLLTLNRNKGKESLQSGKHNKNPLKRKRARSRDLAPKQRQIEQLN